MPTSQESPNSPSMPIETKETNVRIVSNLPTQSKTIMRWRASFICTNKSIRTIGVADTGQLFSVDA